MYGLTRGVTTLIGAAAAGLLLWIASQTDTDSTGGYSLFIAIVAAAGLIVALSQIVGGWTKWGWPRLSGEVLLIAFLPALVAGGWLLMARQPGSNWFQRHTSDWAADVGLDGVFDDLTPLIPAVAFALGLLFGLVVDTTGPRRREAVPEEPTLQEAPVHDDAAVEPVRAERVDEVRRVEDFHEPDEEAVAALTRDRRVEIREGGSPVAPQPDGDDDRSAA